LRQHFTYGLVAAGTAGQIYINDPRNGRAAETLSRLADEAVNLSDEQWAELQPFYSWASQTWCEAVSQAASRRISTQHPYLSGVRAESRLEIAPRINRVTFRA